VLHCNLSQIVDLPFWVLVVAAVGGCSPLAMHRWSRLSAIAGARHPFAYPPLWFAGTLGSALALGLPALVPPIAKSLGLDGTARQLAIVGGAYGLGGGLLLVAFAIVAHFRRRAIASLPPKAGPVLASFDDLRRWLKTDHPVDGEADDAFGLRAVADRVARRLLAVVPTAQAIVGPLGSGKSSILRLVQEKLERRAAAVRVRLVPVALWPFDNSRAAVEGIIQALIDKVGEEVDVVALRNLPEAYVEAMSAASGWIGALARLQGVRSPTETLSAIDKVAVATGLQFVVWIEDLERFAGPSEDAEEKLNPIRALLFALDQLTAVTIVTATTSLRLRFDLEKIARHVEEIPRLPERDVARILGEFRRGCRDLRKYIDPASSTVREQLDGLVAAREAADLFGLLMHRIADALPELCATPRTLKQALRGCFEAWDELLGEIDFDDLLVLSVLREGQPDAFALLQNYLAYWRGLGPRDEKESREVRGAWDIALVRAVPDEHTRKAVQIAISFLFEATDDKKPQGLRQRAHADYWLRYLAREAPPASQRDQPVLLVLAKNDDAPVAALLADPANSRVVEDFSFLLDTDRVLRLLQPVVENAARTSPLAWQSGDPPGLIPIWRIWLRRIRVGKFSAAAAFEEVKRAYDYCVPINPAVAAQVEHYFVIAEGTIPDVIGRENRQPARDYLRQALLSAYRGNARALARNLEGANAPILLWLTWGLDRVRDGELVGKPFDGWEELAEVILAASANYPAIMLPQLACLVVRRAKEFRSKVTYTFDADLARTLFGDPQRVLALWERTDPAHWVGEEHVVAVLRAASKLAPEPEGGIEDDEG